MTEDERKLKLQEMHDKASKIPATIAMERITNALIEDIMAMSDDEIIAEAIEDGIDIEAETERIRKIIEMAIESHEARVTHTNQERE